MTAIDTSVAIAAMVEWHEFHRSCAPAAAEASIPAHALVETYSVLTRLPAPNRLEPKVVRELLDRRFGSGRVLTASAGIQRGIVGSLVEAGVAGGAAYDGLVGLVAQSHGHRLLTCDVRAQKTYERLGVDYELVAVQL